MTKEPKKRNDIAELGKKTRFKKGHPPTPGAGRPRGSISITDALRRLMDLDSPKPCPMTGEVVKMRDEVGMAAMYKALKGDVGAINLILDRLEGKLPTKNEQTGKDGEPIKIESQHTRSVSEIDTMLADFIGCGASTDHSAVS